MFIASTSIGSLPTPWTASLWKRTPRSREILPISAIGWIVPISLLANMIETRTVLSVIAAPDVVGIDPAVLVDRQVGDRRQALALEAPAGVEHGLVLGHLA